MGVNQRTGEENGAAPVTDFPTGAGDLRGPTPRWGSPLLELLETKERIRWYAERPAEVGSTSTVSAGQARCAEDAQGQAGSQAEAGEAAAPNQPFLSSQVSAQYAPVVATCQEAWQPNVC